MKSLLKNSSFALALALAGCGDSGDDDKPIEEARENTLALINGIDLMGTWESKCHKTDLFDKATITTYTFAGDNVEKSYKVFDDDECDDDDNEQLAVLTYKGESKIQSIEDRDSYRKLDLKFKKVVVKLNSETAVKFFDSIDFCNYEDWKVGEEIDLTDESEDSNCPLPKAKDTAYELIKIDDEKLYFGNPGLTYAENADDRPSEVDTDRPYKKKSK